MLRKLGYKLRPFGPLARVFVSTKKLTFERCYLSIQNCNWISGRKLHRVKFRFNSLIATWQEKNLAIRGGHSVKPRNDSENN